MGFIQNSTFLWIKETLEIHHLRKYTLFIYLFYLMHLQNSNVLRKVEQLNSKRRNFIVLQRMLCSSWVWVFTSLYFQKSSFQKQGLLYNVAKVIIKKLISTGTYIPNIVVSKCKRKETSHTNNYILKK